MASSLNNLATLYSLMARYRDAEPLYRQALEIKRKVLGESHPAVATSLNNLGLLYKTMGNYAEAMRLYQQAMAIQRQIWGENHPSFATSLNNLALLYETMGNYAQAEPLYRQALAIEREFFGESHRKVATSLNNLAALYEMMGNYAQAERLYRQVLEIDRHSIGEEHPDIAIPLNNLAVLYDKMGNYAAAEQLYLKVLAIKRQVLGESHPVFANSLNNLALLYKAMGKYATAELLYHQVSGIWRQALGAEHPEFTSSLNNLAELYREIGNYTAAEPLYQQALAIRRQILGEEHPTYATSLNNLAQLYRFMGQYAAAEPLYRQASEIWRTAWGELHPSFATNLNNLAVLHVATHREIEALPLIEQAATIHDKMMGQVFSIGSERQRMAYLATLKANFDICLSLVVEYFAHLPTAIQAALELVLRRKAIGAEALAVQRDAVLGGRYPTLEAKVRQLRTLRMQIAQKTLAGSAPSELDAHQQLLAQWNAQREELEAELARQIPQMNLERQLRAADQEVVASALPPEAVLIEFVRVNLFDFKAVPAKGEPEWKPARYLAFVLPAGKEAQMIDLGFAEAIDQMVAAVRGAMTGDVTPLSKNLSSDSRAPRHGKPFSPLSDEETSTSDARLLREKLFDPLLPALGKRTRLFLAPDGDLNRLPFEVLPSPSGDGRRLIDEYQISYLGVGRDLLRFGAPSTLKSTAPLVVADPDFDLGGAHVAVEEPRGRQSRDLDSRALHFTRLSGTRLEGEQVATMLGVKPLLERDALESTLKACQSPRLLHIATHGFFLPDTKRDLNQEPLKIEADKGGWLGRLSGAGLENPLLRSGLALAGANTWLKGQTLPVEAEDGILTAEDVSGLDLLATELVVLSACETGLGEVQVGEGVFGLRRAFMLAGAKTLVMTLWKVPDRQTQELMEDFYRRILKGEPRAEALRQAQLVMKKKYPDPYYWGAFICQGDPSALSG